MTGDPETCRTPVRPHLGHPWRTSPETQRATVLILGHFIVFLLSIGHDEIARELVQNGWIAIGSAERVEVLIGLGLFLVWGFLTVRLVDLMRRPARDGAVDKAKR